MMSCLWKALRWRDIYSGLTTWPLRKPPTSPWWLSPLWVEDPGLAIPTLLWQHQWAGNSSRFARHKKHTVVLELQFSNTKIIKNLKFNKVNLSWQSRESLRRICATHLPWIAIRRLPTVICNVFPLGVTTKQAEKSVKNILHSTFCVQVTIFFSHYQKINWREAASKRTSFTAWGLTFIVTMKWPYFPCRSDILTKIVWDR